MILPLDAPASSTSRESWAAVLRSFRHSIAPLAALAILASTAPAQTLSAWERFDFARRRVDSIRLETLSLSELRSLRGIVFGRHGRPFNDEADVRAYLKTRPWYRPDPAYSNGCLSAMEKANIDVIRRVEERFTEG